MRNLRYKWKILKSFWGIFQFKFLSKIEKEKLEKRGCELFIENNNQNRESTISDEEKLKLLKFSIQHNIDITKILKEEYNCTIHSLKKFQSEKLLKNMAYEIS